MAGEQTYSARTSQKLHCSSLFPGRKMQYAFEEQTDLGTLLKLLLPLVSREVHLTPDSSRGCVPVPTISIHTLGTAIPDLPTAAQLDGSLQENLLQPTWQEMFVFT